MEKARILIVEDEAIVSIELQKTLEQLGYRVTGTADRGADAVVKAEEEQPDLILMDIHLKDKMDGIEAASRIHLNHDIPVIFVTAYADEDKLERAKLALPYGYLLKPIQSRDLRVTVEMALYASRVNKERIEARNALKEANENLERIVEERTADLRREIEERKRIEERLSIAKKEAEEANNAKSSFLANVSHELRNPMHQIIAFSKSGDEKYDKTNDEKRRHYFKQIRKSADRLLVLLNNLLDLSKLESGRTDFNLAEHDLVALIDDAVNEFKPSLEEKQLAIEMENFSAAQSIHCDAYKIGQVIRNLLSNTIKFSPEKRKIRINIRQSSTEYEGKSVPSVTLAFIDQGIGIPEDHLDLIFEKFSQSGESNTPASGTGLGLAISREIIKGHKGRIWAENNPEGGAVFKIVLPHNPGG